MVLIGKKVIVEFGASHPTSRNALKVWELIIRETIYNTFNELKKTFPTADYVAHQYTIFNIGGNKYRLISEINYPASVVNVKRIWTHAEYSEKKNQEAIRRNKL